MQPPASQLQTLDADTGPDITAACRNDNKTGLTEAAHPPRPITHAASAVAAKKGPDTSPGAARQRPSKRITPTVAIWQKWLNPRPSPRLTTAVPSVRQSTLGPNRSKLVAAQRIDTVTQPRKRHPCTPPSRGRKSRQPRASPQAGGSPNCRRDGATKTAPHLLKPQRPYAFEADGRNSRARS